MTKAYLLFYDTDNGERKDWNIFYTPVEAFASEADRQAREDFLKAVVVDDDGKLMDYESYTADLDFMTAADITVTPDV